MSSKVNPYLMDEINSLLTKYHAQAVLQAVHSWLEENASKEDLYKEEFLLK